MTNTRDVISRVLAKALFCLFTQRHLLVAIKAANLCIVNASLKKVFLE